MIWTRWRARAPWAWAQGQDTSTVHSIMRIVQCDGAAVRAACKQLSPTTEARQCRVALAVSRERRLWAQGEREVQMTCRMTSVP